MNKDLVSKIYYATECETSKDDISAAIDSMSEVARALLFDGYNEAVTMLEERTNTLIEKSDNIWRLNITAIERDMGLEDYDLALSRVGERFDTELKVLWQKVAAF